MIQDIQEIAKQTLANSAAFQSLVDAEDATEAAARIYHDAWPKPESGLPAHSLDEMNDLRPSAIVYTEDDRGFVSERDASGDLCWHQSGCVRFIIFRNVPEADIDDPSLVDTAFRTIIGEIHNDLVELSETAGMLAARRITFSGPHRTAVNELNDIGDAQAAELIVEWGVR